MQTFRPKRIGRTIDSGWMLSPGGVSGGARPAEPRLGCALVIEDDVALLVALARYLSAEGFQVLSATDGAVGLSLFERRADEIRLAFVDLTLPSRDGGEILSAIRRARPDLPVVIMSGLSEADVTRAIGGDRPDAILPKPFDLADLRQLLDQLR